MTHENPTETNTPPDPVAGDDPPVGATVQKLSVATEQSKDPPQELDQQLALADYQMTVEVVKLLTDIRFRCLVFVTAVIAVANALPPRQC